MRIRPARVWCGAQLDKPSLKPGETACRLTLACLAAEHPHGIQIFSEAYPTNSALLCLAGTRVALDMTTLTIMRMLPREVDP